MGRAGEQRGRAMGRVLLCLAALIAIAFAGTAHATAPVGSNGKIAYGAFVPMQADSTEILVINPDGTGTTNLTKTAVPISESEPSWSPTGARIAFTRCNSGVCDIAVMNADGSGVANLTNTPGAIREQRPAFSADGQLIAYDRTEGGAFGSSIWVMNQDGTNQHPLTSTTTPNADFTPDFSPDGNSITYSHCTPGPNHQCDIWLMNSDGSGQHALTATPAPSSELGGSFSPTGRSIVFQLDSSDSSADDLAIMNADGSGQRALIQTQDAERRPVFSGDGSRLAFMFTPAAGGQTDIFTSDANGQTQTNLTRTFSSEESEFNPDWEDVQTCGRSRATIVGDDGSDRLLGTKKRNVVDANAATTGKNVVKGKAGNDLICVGPGKAKVNCGKGKRDKVVATGKGKRKVKGCEIKKGKFGKPKRK